MENQVRLQLQLHQFCIINYNYDYNYVIGPNPVQTIGEGLGYTGDNVMIATAQINIQEVSLVTITDIY